MKYHRPNCGFFIFEPFDSWKRQPTAGGDSKTFMDSFVSSNIKTGWVSFNSISAQTYFVRRKRESAFPAGPTPQGFSNRHSPLTMYRRTEVFQFTSIASQRHMLFILFFILGIWFLPSKNFLVCARQPTSTKVVFVYRDKATTYATYNLRKLNLNSNGPCQINFEVCYDWLVLLELMWYLEVLNECEFLRNGRSHCQTNVGS